MELGHVLNQTGEGPRPEGEVGSVSTDRTISDGDRVVTFESSIPGRGEPSGFSNADATGPFGASPNSFVTSGPIDHPTLDFGGSPHNFPLFHPPHSFAFQDDTSSQPTPPQPLVFVPASASMFPPLGGDVLTPPLTVGLSSVAESGPVTHQTNFGNFRHMGLAALGCDGSVESISLLAASILSSDDERKAFLGEAGEDRANAVRASSFISFLKSHYWVEHMQRKVASLTASLNELSLAKEERNKLLGEREGWLQAEREARERADALEVALAEERDKSAALESVKAALAEEKVKNAALENEKAALVEEKMSVSREKISQEEESADKCMWYVENTAAILVDCFKEVHGAATYQGAKVTDAFRLKSTGLNDEGFRQAKAKGYKRQRRQ